LSRPDAQGGQFMELEIANLKEAQALCALVVPANKQDICTQEGLSKEPSS